MGVVHEQVASNEHMPPLLLEAILSSMYGKLLIGHVPANACLSGMTDDATAAAENQMAQQAWKSVIAVLPGQRAICQMAYRIHGCYALQALGEPGLAL